MAKSQIETRPVKIVTQIPKLEVKGSVPKMQSPPQPPSGKKGSS